MTPEQDSANSKAETMVEAAPGEPVHPLVPPLVPLVPLVQVAPPDPVSSTGPCAIVGIGASAGGLEAFEAFFKACPADTGLGFVLIPHLDPGHESLLVEILQRSTQMPVVQAVDETKVEANSVYIIPPNRDMAILGGELQLTLPDVARGKRMPIDGFLRSLAADQGERAIGIILSGTASDGTLGLRALLDAGGTSLVQEPSSARYDGMPQSAIKAGLAKHVLLAEQMPALLKGLSKQNGYKPPRAAVAPLRNASALNKILLQLRASVGHDFSLYKKSTIGRRIQRRMTLHQIEDDAVYARMLKENPAEAQLLFRELLINVTSFFRDPEAFVMLKQSLLPPLLESKPAGSVFRVWVAGCSTGEEAYSIAMLLHELQGELLTGHVAGLTFQIYATDLDDEAIAVARAGRYPASIALDITPERLRRFFNKEEGGSYKVKKEVRDMVVFAVQNVIKDPPFTRLDLLSCRNLMIYLEPELQQRLISTFHYALRPHGLLLLSTSESITNQPELFAPLDRKWKFYQARHEGPQGSMVRDRKIDLLSGVSMLAVAPQVGTTGVHVNPKSAIAARTDKLGAQIAEISNRQLLQAFAPASVTTDVEGNILYIHGDTGRYLRPAPGPASFNVLEMAREGLLPSLRTALLQAAAGTNSGPGTGSSTGPGPGSVNSTALGWPSELVSVKTNGGYSPVRFSVRGLPRLANQQPMLQISFEELQQASDSNAGASSSINPSSSAGSEAASVEQLRIKELERKLNFANETLQATHEEQQAFNEELKSTNEELQSTNEELQSSNEELETSKEELQSLNEETITVNAELNSRIEQLTSVQNDMKNLLDSIGSGTLFLDHQLCIRRFTPATLKIYRLIPSDVGRPLSDITCNLDAAQHQAMQADLQAVLDSLIPIEREVSTADGAWHLSRIQPYRTLDNVIEGVVVSFTDVSEFKRASLAAAQAAAELSAAKQVAAQMAAQDAAQLSMQLARDLAEGIVNTVSEPLLVLDAALQVVSASRSFYAHFKVAPTDTVGRKIYELGNGQWNIAALRELLENILLKNQAIDGYEVRHDFPGLGPQRMVLNAHRIITSAGETELILLAMVAIEVQAAG
ncbi:PAS domain-containing protein [Paucibacter sp. B2R-40]|uniref:CheR family methyltransferase n=1 Tax=Paucibacter sp. B2R-40 TaxID=2893554 RepID=UPI0021E3A7A7|nr:CheR family methyltransferase [Paucibacter sp. B2R-40]MCV2355837.1 PAS domain-containing protein [Paucibacter sp. B2R-40]